MVRDLDMPVGIIGISTMREVDGLAMSSRNGYLSEQERIVAKEIFAGLQIVATQLRQGAQDYSALELAASQRLVQFGFIVDYLTVRRAVDLAVPQAGEKRLVVLVAARLGNTRLIDNVLIDMD
jgi:pantoate--beta-alanine ligase